MNTVADIGGRLGGGCSERHSKSDNLSDPSQSAIDATYVSWLHQAGT